MIQLELETGFYWVVIDGDEPTIAWFDEVTRDWWTISSDLSIIDEVVQVISKKLTYTGETA